MHYMDINTPDDHLDSQHKQVLLRDAKYFFKLDKILDLLNVKTLLDLRKLSISDLKNNLTENQVIKIIDAMSKWSVSPKNWKEPSDIQWMDNTGHTYTVSDNGYKEYPPQ